MAAPLTGSSQPVPIGEGYAVRAPGIVGVADLQHPRSHGERARSRSPRDGTPALEEALANTNVTETREVELTLQPRRPGATAAVGRGAAGGETIELEVPDLGPAVGQVVLATDEAGVMTWHLPLDMPVAGTPGATRGTGAKKRFRIPATQPAPPPGTAANRGLIGMAGRKLLKVLVYPIVDPAIGAISEAFAERWETSRRPYGLRMFTPEAFRQPGAAPLSAADWAALQGGRSLLFVHGTFSTAHGAFNLIADPVFRSLFDRYEGRVFAFNHFTLSHDPHRNVDWLLQQLPSGPPLEVDIICHSRGGLVARTLAEQPPVAGVDAARIAVRRIVFVGVPNAGTLLANPDHMITMIDRFTTALNLFPSGAITETLEAIITTVKVLGHGALNGLDGLASMRPGGAFLTALNQGAPAGDGYYAIASDYEPAEQGLRALLTGSLADNVLDRIFENAGNDLVVPESGVYSANGSGAFPIPESRVLRVPPAAGVLHTTFFGHAPACAKIAEWLT